MKVKFRKLDNQREYDIDVAPDSKLRANYSAIQLLLGLPEDRDFNFLLEKDNSLLPGDLTFNEAHVQENDAIILVPPEFKAKGEKSVSPNISHKSMEVSHSDSSARNIIFGGVGIVSLLIVCSFIYAQVNRQSVLTKNRLHQAELRRQDAEQKLAENQQQLEVQAELLEAQKQLQEEQSRRLETERQLQEVERQQEINLAVKTQRVQFAQGATGTTLQGTTVASRLEHFLLQLGKGQQLTVSIFQGNIWAKVYAPDGSLIGQSSSQDPSLRILLPSNGDYIVEISGVDNSAYSVDIEVITIAQDNSLGISQSGVAIVFDPPSNVRDSPNGAIICSVQISKTINIYSPSGDWYKTDVCGATGFIHNSQLQF